MVILKGANVSPGIGIGRIVIIEEPDLSYESKAVENVDAEKARLADAISDYVKFTQAQAEQMKESVGEKEAEILQGHVLMISDPYMQGEMMRIIEGGTCAEDALTQICEQFAAMFEASGDELTMARAADVRDIRSGVLAELLNARTVSISSLPPRSVIVTHELTPSMTAEINRNNVVGVITETGGVTSHSAILARALEIPAVMAVTDACSSLPAETLVIVNGSAGTVTTDPDDATMEAAKNERELFRQEQANLKQFIGKKTVTADDEELLLVANIGNAEQAQDALERDAEGVGLFRTEFLFMDTDTMPTEDQQFEAYKKAAVTMKGKPVIIRTLDIGGDKEIPYLGMEKEENPFLGFRAIRYCLQREDVYRTQLRALLRAASYGDIHIMVPLVTCVDEIREVKTLIKRYADEFEREGVKCNPDVKVGIMIETPASAIMADALAEEADFFSIGTNDLTGYTMACDRGNDSVRYLYSTYNPAVLRSIRNVIAAGNEKGIMVGMCGEAAADPILIPLWIAFGLGEYSVSATSILRTRKEIYGWTVEEAKALADEVMKLTTETEIHDALVAAHEARVKAAEKD